MKRIFILVPAFVTVLFTFQACKHEPLVPETPVISYSADIKPIINSNCTQPGCHGTVNPEFSLLTYEDVINEGEVKAKSPKNSGLYRSITGKGEELMPRSPNPPLTADQIELIYWWIMQGAKNN